MLPVGMTVAGAVLTDQIRSLDQRARILRRVGVAPGADIAEDRHQIAKLLGL
ncbi:hypothetical protein [Methylobacterium sp. PvR107]|uniref:hypothetical protein n=1 Tax=Methylobacterium sp. PvR107 TaxID=2806597 RepID=UPI001B3D706C|nr:hypothetical protein [Methylobacterium sp. PvR107]MBP1182290.1 mRNA-degrading endonuclease toxin of MazEF toxin-antitoxin module [Methylobacterium sp. PvR107]